MALNNQLFGHFDNIYTAPVYTACIVQGMYSTTNLRIAITFLLKVQFSLQSSRTE